MPLAGAVPLVRDILLLLLHLALPLAPGLLRLQPWRPALRLACLFLLFLLLLLPRGPLAADGLRARVLAPLELLLVVLLCGLLLLEQRRRTPSAHRPLGLLPGRQSGLRDGSANLRRREKPFFF